jgi:hypothetical protein
MANLYSTSFESGAYPEGISVTNGEPNPFSGYNGYWKWAVTAEPTTDSQAVITADLDTVGAVWCSFRFRACEHDFTSPDPIFEFGNVSVTLTSSTNIRLEYDGNTVNKDITTINGQTALGSKWEYMSAYVDVESISGNVISVSYGSEPITEFSISSGGSALDTAQTTMSIRGPRGTLSSIDDVRIDDSGVIGTPPPEIEGHKALPYGLVHSQWVKRGTVFNSSTGMRVKDMAYNTADGYYYSVNEESKLIKFDPRNYSRVVLAQLTDSAFSPCAYHTTLDRVYFYDDGLVKYWDGAAVQATGSTTAFTTTKYAFNNLMYNGALGNASYRLQTGYAYGVGFELATSKKLAKLILNGVDSNSVGYFTTVKVVVYSGANVTGTAAGGDIRPVDHSVYDTIEDVTRITRMTGENEFVFKDVTLPSGPVCVGVISVVGATNTSYTTLFYYDTGVVTPGMNVFKGTTAAAGTPQGQLIFEEEGYLGGGEGVPDADGAYLVSVNAGGESADAIQVHAIDGTGTVTKVNNGVADLDPVGADVNKNLNVFYDRVSNKILFPLFHRGCLGMFNCETNILDFSGVIGTDTVLTSIQPATPLLDDGRFLVTCHDVNKTEKQVLRHNMQTFSTSSGFSNFTSYNYLTGYQYNYAIGHNRAGFHPFLGYALHGYFENDNVYSARLPNVLVHEKTDAQPSLNTSYFGEINPFTNGMFALDNGVLVELRLFTNKDIENIMISDRTFYESATSNETIVPVMCNIIPDSKIKEANIVLNNAIGRSNVTVASTDQTTKTETLSAISKDISIKVSAEPPEYSFIFTDSPSFPVPNRGTQVGSSCLGSNFSITTNKDISLNGTSYAYSTQSSSVGSSLYFSTGSETIAGDFTVIYHGTLTGQHEKMRVLNNQWEFPASTGALTTPAGTIAGVYANTPTTIVFGRSGSTVYYYSGGVLQGTIEYAGSFTIASTVYISTGSYPGSTNPQCSGAEIYTTRWVGGNASLTMPSSVPFHITKT